MVTPINEEDNSGSGPEENEKPEDYYFGICDNAHGEECEPRVVFIPHSFWESDGCIPNWSFPLVAHLPDGFVEVEEHFVSIPYHSVLKAITELENRGFVHLTQIERKFNTFDWDWDW